MSHPIETVRVSNQAREHMIKLKRVTGLQNWNVLCRWGFCLSLADPSLPPAQRIQTDSPIDMSWSVFAGRYEALYLGLLKQRCARDGLGTDPKTLENQFKLHLHRGIAWLATDRGLTHISALFGRLPLTLPGLEGAPNASEPPPDSPPEDSAAPQ